MPAKKAAKKATKPATKKSGGVFSAEERAAMREYVQEKKRAAAGKGDDEATVLAKIRSFTGSDRTMAERVHAIVMGTAPGITTRLWYGMPAYAKDGKVVCFFQDAKKFKSRYATLGFSDKANLDDGNMWPSAFALVKLTPADEARITELVRKAFA